MIDFWFNKAPFGLPVVPEVYTNRIGPCLLHIVIPLKPDLLSDKVGP